MKLIDEIIEALSSQNGSLTDALLKTKVLLHKIGHQELVGWVNNELTGYPPNGTVPEYRIIKAQVLANMANIAYQYNSHPIPIGHLSDKQRESLEVSKMYQSLAALEKLIEKDSGSLQAPIPMEFNGILGEQLASGYVIQRAWCSIERANIAQIFVQVRSRLLDFILGLKDQFGDNVPDKDIRKHADAFDTSSLFNNAIFGDNTTIVVGSHNKQDVTNIIVKGNFNALADHLRENGVDESSLAALQLAIQQDEGAPEIGEMKYGPSVKAWLQNMLSKAVESSWQIELGVASSLLATALQKFYGWL